MLSVYSPFPVADRSGGDHSKGSGVILFGNYVIWVNIKESFC